MASQKPICPICYEDLKLAVENLQSITHCGHVLHELCLQQWIEYCPAGKKPSCPVCKQSCSPSAVTRLYFQSSAGDNAGSPQRDMGGPVDVDVDVMVEKLRRMESRVSSYVIEIEKFKSQVKELTDECSSWKELAKREAANKDEIFRAKEFLERQVQVKSEELLRKSAECMKIEERSLGLAKELAVLKMATDCNLGEDEIVKLASLGNEMKKSNAVDVLQKSLALRNKSYKELMAQCNLLGRSETRALQQLDKAKEKIRTLKARLLELEREFENRENGVLRDIDASSKSKAMNSENLVPKASHTPSGEHHVGHFAKELPNSNNNIKSINHHAPRNKCPRDPIHMNNDSLGNQKSTDVIYHNDDLCLFQDDTFQGPSELCKKPAVGLEFLTEEKSHNGKGSSFSLLHTKDSLAGANLGLNLSLKNIKRNIMKETLEKNASGKRNPTRTLDRMPDDDHSKETHVFTVDKDYFAHSSASNGQPSFIGGHFGLESARKSSGKWHKHIQPKTSSLVMQASTYHKNLIVVGPDGRGGRVKALRTRAEENNVDIPSSKRHKVESHQSCQFQIDHFFGKRM